MNPKSCNSKRGSIDEFESSNLPISSKKKRGVGKFVFLLSGWNFSVRNFRGGRKGESWLVQTADIARKNLPFCNKGKDGFGKVLRKREKRSVSF